MTQIDDMFINYYDSKKVKRVLTPDGYTIDKEGYSIFGVTLADAEEGGKKVAAQLSDIKTGAERGFAKLAEGTGSLALAGLEKLNFISDGSVEKFGEFFAKEVYPRIGETETLAGGLTEGISQFLVPGVGYYKLFGALMTVPKNASRIKKFVNSVGRVTAAEGAAVGTAQVAGDPNFASFLNEFLNIDQKLAEGITKDFAVYLTTPETSKDADAVLREKLKATIADTPVAYAAEGLMAFAKILKAIKGDPKTSNEIDTSYRMEFHQAKGPMDENPIRLDNLTKDVNGEQAGYPNDFYTKKGKQIYAPGHKFKDDEFGIANNESYNIITKAKDNPDMEVTIYRAVPNEDNITKINEGDFVTLSKKYAELHGASGYGSMGNDAGKILEMKVKVKDLYWDGNDVNEFGYFPSGGTK